MGAGKNIGSSNICTPWILSGKFNFLEDMLWLFFNSRYVFHRINTSLLKAVAWSKNNNKKNMGFIAIYNDPLHLKVHVFHAMCIWKPYMKNIPYPLPMGGIFNDNNF